MCWCKNNSIWTSATIVLFIIVAHTGLFMFFHVAPHSLMVMHELIGLLFVVASVFHIVCNWIKFKRYFEFKSVITLTVLALVALVVPLLYPGTGKQHFSSRILFDRIEKSQLRVTGQLFGLSESQLFELFKQSNVKVDNLNQTVYEISRLNDKQPIEVIQLLFGGLKHQD